MNRWIVAAVLALSILTAAMGLGMVAAVNNVAGTTSPMPVTPWFVESTTSPMPVTPWIAASTTSPMPVTPW